MSEHSGEHMTTSGGGTAERAALLLVSLVAVGLAMGLGWVILVGGGWTAHTRELLAAGIVNVLAGTLAALPAIMMVGRGGGRVAQAVMAGMLIRVVVDAGGTIILMAPGWAMDKNWLLGFVGAFYCVLLAAESAVAAWVVRRGK